MPIVFKYKHNNCDSLAPGYTKGSGAGVDGDIGESGSAIFFLDTEINDSYSMSLILEKIQNNYAVSRSDTELSARPYKTNDLFCTPNGEYYKLSFAENLPVLTFLGKTKNIQILPKIHNVCIHYIPESYASYERPGFAVSNKNINTKYADINSSSNQDVCAKTGVWVVFHVPGITEQYPVLTIEFPQQKRMDINSTPKDTYSDDNVPFVWNYCRPLEIVNLYTEETFPEDISLIDNKYKYFINTDLLDEYVLYGNNIKCTLNNGKTQSFDSDSVDIETELKNWSDKFMQSSDKQDGNIDSDNKLSPGNSVWVSSNANIQDTIKGILKNAKISLTVLSDNRELIQKQINVEHHYE